jgi:hypothetical protein
MIYSNQHPESVRSFLEKETWQLGGSYPGPNAFFPSRTAYPRLYFTCIAGVFRLSWEDRHGKHGVIDALSDRGCPEALREKAQSLVLMLQVGDSSTGFHSMRGYR